MTMVDGAAKTERLATTEQWQKPRRLSESRNGRPGGIMLGGAGLVATLLVVLLLWWAAARQPQVASVLTHGVNSLHAKIH